MHLGKPFTEGAGLEEACEVAAEGGGALTEGVWAALGRSAEVTASHGVPRHVGAHRYDVRHHSGGAVHGEGRGPEARVGGRRGPVYQRLSPVVRRSGGETVIGVYLGI